MFCVEMMKDGRMGFDYGMCEWTGVEGLHHFVDLGEEDRKARCLFFSCESSGNIL